MRIGRFNPHPPWRVDATRLVSQFYRALWQRIGGRPWTYIMRSRPWLYILPAIGMMVTMAWARRKYKGWVIGLAVGVAAFLGFIGGHVFW